MKVRACIMTCAAIVGFGLAVGVATANRLASNVGDIYFVWDEISQPLTFSGTFEVICEVSLLGSLHTRTVTKVAHTLVGHINHIAIENCSTPTDIPEDDLPWHVTYEAFSGSLPNITRVRLLLVNFTILFEADFGNCIVRADTTPMAFEAIREASGAITALETDPRPTIDSDDLSGSFFCDLGSVNAIGEAAVEDGVSGDVDLSLV